MDRRAQLPDNPGRRKAALNKQVEIENAFSHGRFSASKVDAVAPAEVVPSIPDSNNALRIWHSDNQKGIQIIKSVRCLLLSAWFFGRRVGAFQLAAWTDACATKRHVSTLSQTLPLRTLRPYTQKCWAKARIPVKASKPQFGRGHSATTKPRTATESKLPRSVRRPAVAAERHRLFPRVWLLDPLQCGDLSAGDTGPS